MEHLDMVLKHWAARMEEFPETLCEREETGCCFTAQTGTEGVHDPPPQ